MSAADANVPMLVFEAADCLMAVPASEVSLDGSDPLSTSSVSGEAFDLSEYFAGRAADGPWLRWRRGARTAWLRVARVVDVVPVPLAGLKAMPALLRGHRRTRAFLAAGAQGADVFLLLDPARLTPGAVALKSGLSDPPGRSSREGAA